MADIKILPAISYISVTGSAVMQGSGSATTASIFTVTGNNGALFSVTDDLSTSIFSANTISGLPVIEAFSNYCTVLGQYNGHRLVITSGSIGGGKCTTASGNYSFVGGGKSNTASATYTVVAGGCSNLASAYLTTVGGGVCNRATFQYSTIGGGFFNQALGSVSTVGGGESNYSGAGWTTVAGGCGNYAYGAVGVFVGGGLNNCSRNTVSAIAGGQGNDIPNGYGFIGGGYFNVINGFVSTIAGGQSNNIGASGNRAFIGGGLSNSVSAAYGTVGGGRQSTASAPYSTVAGGFCNTASGTKSAVGGGQANTASGAYSFTAGYGNTVSGAISVAFGQGNSVTGVRSITVGLTNSVSGTYSAAFGCGLTAASSCYLYANNICNVSGGTSDCRMKHSICPITYNLDQITKLKPTSFVFNNDCSNFRRYGFIAQEVCQVVPEIITYHPIDKVDSQGNVGGEVDGEPILQFEKDAVYASYVNAFKELKDRLEVVEAILKNNNLM